MRTVRIPLANDKGFFVVDEEDIPLISQYRWHRCHVGNKFYARAAGPAVNGKQPAIMAHRLIMGVGPDEGVDHRDGNGLNNARENLRKASPAQNAANKGMARNNTSGYKGVSLVKASGKWLAGIQRAGKSYSLGLYSAPEEAARAYDAKAREFFGDFARCNFPLGGDVSQRTIEMRDITAAEKANHAVPAHSSSGVRNVFLSARTGRYEVKFNIGGVPCKCGTYVTIAEAAAIAERVRTRLKD